MRIIVNGAPRDVADGSTLRDLLADRLGGPPLAVERNGEPVSREAFDEIVLQPGDRLEVVRFVGGG